MPEYLAPGVYVEESGLPPLIQGLPTSIAAFVGEFPSGPTNQPKRLTSTGDLEKTFEDAFSDAGDAVSQFFKNGGQTCWAVRIVSDSGDSPPTVAAFAAGLQALDQVDLINPARNTAS